MAAIAQSDHLLALGCHQRAVAVGFGPDGQSATVAGSTPLQAVERCGLGDRTVVWELTRRLLAEVAERARERMGRLGELDAASEDVVIYVVRTLEEQLRMIRVRFPYTFAPPSRMLR